MPDRTSPTRPLPVTRLQAASQRFWSIPHRTEGDELLDETDQDLAELASSLRDVRRVNLLFGGLGTVRRNLPRLLEATSPERPVTILDLATGSADIPINVVRWAREQGRDVEITATDFSPDILTVAARRVAKFPNIHLLQCDAREVPFPDASFDIVLCSLALHHFPPADAVRVLAEMDRLSRVGFIVNDLARSRPGYIGAWLVGRLATRNRITRHDAPLSALRAYTPEELRAMLNEAGLKDVVVRPSPWFRMAAVQLKSSDDRWVPQGLSDEILRLRAQNDKEGAGAPQDLAVTRS